MWCKLFWSPHIIWIFRLPVPNLHHRQVFSFHVSNYKFLTPDLAFLLLMFWYLLRFIIWQDLIMKNENSSSELETLNSRQKNTNTTVPYTTTLWDTPGYYLHKLPTYISSFPLNNLGNFTWENTRLKQIPTWVSNNW